VSGHGHFHTVSALVQWVIAKSSNSGTFFYSPHFLK